MEKRKKDYEINQIAQVQFEKQRTDIESEKICIAYVEVTKRIRINEEVGN